jgi:hypothetical protein
MEAKAEQEAKRGQEATAAVLSGFESVVRLLPVTGLVPTELVRDMLASLEFGLQAVERVRGQDFGFTDSFCHVTELVDACGEQMPAEVARGLLALVRWLAGDQALAGAEVVS